MMTGSLPCTRRPALMPAMMPCRAVDLARKEQALDFLGLKPRRQFSGLHHVIFNGITGPDHFCVLKSRDGFHHRYLNINGHGSGHAVDVDFISIQALGLQENLVLKFIRELDDFVFNRGAITRAQALDLPRVKRRTMQIVAEDLVSFGIRITDPAHGLRLTDGPGSEAERCGNRIARLHLKPGEVNGARIKTRGGSRLEPSHFKSKPSQGLT